MLDAGPATFQEDSSEISFGRFLRLGEVYDHNKSLHTDINVVKVLGDNKFSRGSEMGK